MSPRFSAACSSACSSLDLTAQGYLSETPLDGCRRGMSGPGSSRASCSPSRSASSRCQEGLAARGAAAGRRPHDDGDRRDEPVRDRPARRRPHDPVPGGGHMTRSGHRRSRDLSIGWSADDRAARARDVHGRARRDLRHPRPQRDRASRRCCAPWSASSRRSPARSSSTERKPGTWLGRPTFGVMFQQGALFGSMTVGENIALPARDVDRSAARRDPCRSSAPSSGWSGSSDAIDRLAAELSGGMRKRAAHRARARARSVAVFLDEPSSGLDPITSAEIDRLILTLAGAARPDRRASSRTSSAASNRSSTAASCSTTKDAESPRSGHRASSSNAADPRVRHFFTRTAEAA